VEVTIEQTLHEFLATKGDDDNNGGISGPSCRALLYKKTSCHTILYAKERAFVQATWLGCILCNCTYNSIEMINCGKANIDE
jgi:hypothetical protein